MLKVFAEDLKTVREEKNLSLRSIAQQTRLNIVILENIENGDFTFQPQAYIRAFLKQYIAALDLDVEETLFDYDLARSGKYKQKYEHRKEVSQSPSSEQNSEEADAKISVTKDEVSSIQNAERKNLPLKETSRESDSQKFRGDEDVASGKSEKKREHKVTLKSPDDKPVNNYYTPNKNFLIRALSLPAVRNIGLIIFLLLVLLGLYSLINILFLEGSKDSPEIIRQDFNEVVKEQEKKILGKRTPEEIQDSIRKAEEQLVAAKDSITLKLVAVSDGTVFIVTDSSDYKNPSKIEFEKGQTGTFKAAKSFHISASNTSTFKASVNNNPIKFDKTSVSKVKIDKNGIVK